MAEILTSSVGSRHVPLDQLLLSSSKELTESSGSLLNAKRLGEHNPLGASKRPRYGVLHVALKRNTLLLVPKIYPI